MTTYKIANLLTLVRILAIPIVIILLFRSQHFPPYKIHALFILIFMQASDILDGFLARLVRRKTGVANPWGQLLDPIADKLYINSTYVTLSITHNFPMWITAAIVGRDMIIIIGWTILAILTKEKTIIPNFWGKVCDSSQALLIFAFLLDIPPQFFNYGAILTVLFTVISGISYVWQGVNTYISSKGTLTH